MGGPQEGIHTSSLVKTYLFSCGERESWPEERESWAEERESWPEEEAWKGETEGREEKTSERKEVFFAKPDNKVKRVIGKQVA